MNNVKDRLTHKRQVDSLFDYALSSFEEVERLIENWKASGYTLDCGDVYEVRQETDAEYEIRMRKMTEDTERRRKQYEKLKKEFEGESPTQTLS